MRPQGCCYRSVPKRMAAGGVVADVAAGVADVAVDEDFDDANAMPVRFGFYAARPQRVREVALSSTSEVGEPRFRSAWGW